MKSKLIFLIILNIFIVNAHSQTTGIFHSFEFGLSSSYSLSYFDAELKEKPAFSSVVETAKPNPVLSFGFDFTIESNWNNAVLRTLFTLSKISLSYQYSFIENNDNYLIFGLSIYPFFLKSAFTPLIGINGSYNFYENKFSVIPEIGVSFFHFYSLTYRYNITIGKDYNKHEISIKLMISLLKRWAEQ